MWTVVLSLHESPQDILRRIFGAEVFVVLAELLNGGLQFFLGGEEGCPETVSTFPLAEARTGNDADSGGLQQRHSVKRVHSNALFRGSAKSAFR